MTKTVYLNDSDEVIAESDAVLSLGAAQALNADIATVVEDAPDAVIVKPLPGDTYGTFHTLTSGDGTSIDDYTEGDYIEHLRPGRLAEIDARTLELGSTGVFSHGGKDYRLDGITRLAIKLAGLAVATSNIPSVDGTETSFTIITFPAFVVAANDFYQGVLDSGQALRDDIVAASTLAELDAVVDAR